MFCNFLIQTLIKSLTFNEFTNNLGIRCHYLIQIVVNCSYILIDIHFKYLYFLLFNYCIKLSFIAIKCLNFFLRYVFLRVIELIIALIIE